MKKCIVIFSVILGSFSFGHSQTFNIFVEPGELFTATGTPISSSNQQGFNIFTAPYSVSTGDANDFFSTLEANLLSFDEVATGVEELKTFLGSHSWTSLTSSDISGIDFEASSVTTSEGSRPLLFITDASSFSEIGLGSQIGLAGATTTAGSFGLTNYAFNAGSNSLTEIYIGQSGSLHALQIVPEPSIYAALAGLCALALVAVRRRR